MKKDVERCWMSWWGSFRKSLPIMLDVELVDYHEEKQMSKIEPIHAGEILLEEFIQPFGLSQNALANALKVTPRRINEIVNKKRAITADTALRLSKFFGNSAEFWMNLQNKYELEMARDKLFVQIDSEIELFQAS
ncbi:MAG: HigA protein (antitoxin to HigB) [uncultured Sulfurovum sp.]|uniref:HigA protein (Antitoxin to HigB) n=1 Tax=uncultured Sulfurovum sp. TaxID=269237 RepID=A0A6S6UCQ5_9BACT|nr:MAG: HigA protein (antitoxin to HigB) [uncultured Sulfurovum sp.]